MLVLIAFEKAALPGAAPFEMTSFAQTSTSASVSEASGTISVVSANEIRLG